MPWVDNLQAMFGPWQPDVAGPGSGKAQRAEGVYPIATSNGLGYAPFPRLTVAPGSTALSASPRGLIALQAPDNTWAVFAATATTIEKLQSDFTWLVIDSGRTVTAGDDVSFALFGSKLLNTDTTTGMRAYDVLAGGANSAVSSAPAARSVFVAHNTTFALGTSASPRRFATSNVGTYTQWSGGTADAKTLEDGGALVGGADLNNGAAVIFQERCVRGVQFGAGAASYSLSKIADGLGCVAERTIATFDGKVAWWHDDGPWMLTPGTAPVPIGAEKINRWAATSIGRENYKNLQATVDPERKLFLWRLDESRLLAFNYLLNEFSILPATTVAIARIATPAVTVDNLIGTVDSQPGLADQLSGSSAPLLGGLNSARRYSTFVGGNMQAVLQTDLQLLQQSMLFNSATPVDDCGEGVLEIGVADRMDSTLDWREGDNFSRLSGRGDRFRFRARGKVFALRRTIEEECTWTYATGVQFISGNMGGY